MAAPQGREVSLCDLDRWRQPGCVVLGCTRPASPQQSRHAISAAVLSCVAWGTHLLGLGSPPSGPPRLVGVIAGLPAHAPPPRLRQGCMPTQLRLVGQSASTPRLGPPARWRAGDVPCLGPPPRVAASLHCWVGSQIHALTATQPLPGSCGSGSEPNFTRDGRFCLGFCRLGTSASRPYNLLPSLPPHLRVCGHSHSRRGPN